MASLDESVLGSRLKTVTIAWPVVHEITEKPFVRKLAACQEVVGRAGSRADSDSAERFIPKPAIRHRMERGSWVVVVESGTRFLGRFRFHSQTQAEKFVGSAARQGFRAEIEGESTATAPTE